MLHLTASLDNATAITIAKMSGELTVFQEFVKACDF